MRADAQANRDAIVAAAKRQIAARGLDVPLTAVAADAGVGAATLYRNFPTRGGLVLAVLEDLGSRVLGIVDDVSGQMAEAPERAWPRFVHRVADLRMGALVAAFSAQFVTDDRIPEPLMAQRNRVLTAIQQVLDAAKSAGLVRDDLTAARFQMGIASITRPLPNVAVPDMAAHQAWLVDVYLNGLRPVSVPGLGLGGTGSR